MEKTIWDFKKGDKFRNEEGYLCEVVTPTEDGKGLVVKYLEGDLPDSPILRFSSRLV